MSESKVVDVAATARYVTEAIPGECKGVSELSRMRCDLCRRNVTELRAAGHLPIREFRDRRVFGLSACPGRQTCYLCARCYREHVPPDPEPSPRA